MELGERVRSRRRMLRMSQTELAGGRFSKQYVSQIERGVTIPSDEAIDWLAERLEVDRAYLETGLGIAERARVEAALSSAEELLADHRYAEAQEAFVEVGAMLDVGVAGSAGLRATFGEAWASIRLGDLAEADAVLERALRIADATVATARDRAELEYLIAVRRYSSSEIAEAHVAFARALTLLDDTGVADDRLRCDIHQWRSRCYRRQRDWEAANEDVERALELCASLGDTRRTAEVSLQASLVAERQGRWVLARRHAQLAFDLFAELGDEAVEGRALNNLAGLNHLLGHDETAIEQLRRAFRLFVDAQLEVEAGYVMASLAEIHRKRDELTEAEQCARQALALLGDRSDHVQEIGTAQLVLALTHLGQHRLDDAETMLAAADESYAANDSVSHQARSWIARGDLEQLRDDEREAARLYRRAAVALQPTDPSP